MFVSSEKHTVGINMWTRPIWTAKKVTGQKLPKYTLPWAHKKRQSVQTCSKVCLFFSHSEVQVPQVLPGAPSSATLSDKWGRPQVQGSSLTCFSKTQNERKVRTNFTIYDDRPPSLKQKQQRCTAKCYIPTAKKVTGQTFYLWNSHGRNMRVNPCMLYVFIFAVLR